VLFAGLLLRCPRCEHGHMFRNGFKMYHACPVCGLEFERASGEITGGMGVNTVATCLLEVSLAIAFVFTPWPIEWEIVVLVAAGIAFPIAFYRSSRGLWASFLYLTGNNTESD
jgi:uncharacterized protein (DUF983 family)